MLIVILLVRIIAGMVGGYAVARLSPGVGRRTVFIAGGIGGLIGGAFAGATFGAVDAQTANTVAGWLAGMLGGALGGAVLTGIVGQIAKAIRRL